MLEMLSILLWIKAIDSYRFQTSCIALRSGIPTLSSIRLSCLLPQNNNELQTEMQLLPLLGKQQHRADSPKKGQAQLSPGKP